MKRTRMHIFLAVYLGFAGAIQAADQPVLQDGDRWEFKATHKEGITSTSDVLEGMYEAIFRGGQLEIFQITDGQRAGTTAMVAENIKRLVPFKQDDLRFLDFPLSPGKKWNVDYSHTSPGARRAQRRSATFQVEKVEAIKAAAGEFNAVRIKGNGQSTSGDVMRVWEYFYSPDTKSIIKYFYDSNALTKSGKIEIELVKFTAGK